jgi:hypothetical protein
MLTPSPKEKLHTFSGLFLFSLFSMGERNSGTLYSSALWRPPQAASRAPLFQTVEIVLQ